MAFYADDTPEACIHYLHCIITLSDILQTTYPWCYGHRIVVSSHLSELYSSHDLLHHLQP